MRPNLPRIEDKLRRFVETAKSAPVSGLLREAQGLTLRATVDEARIGDVCRLRNPDGSSSLAEITGITDGEALLSPYGSLVGISNLTQVIPQHRPPSVVAGDHMIGQALDAFGRAEGLKPGPDARDVSIYRPAPPALSRQLISVPFTTGIKAIDGFTLTGRGQRVGIFGAAGLGKSTLVSMLINMSDYDVVVLALIGERGREVREVWERHISPAARAKAILVFATSDRPPIERRVAANIAMAIAESYRDRGANVLLIVDSLTRLARAQRDVALAAGEPPVRRGFPPSVASFLAEYVERAGPGSRGTITSFFTVLVEGEIDDDPVAEEAKSLLDGHLILSRKLSEQGIFPAIDVVASRSRLMSAVADREHEAAATRVRSLIARHREIALLIDIGEYKPGQEPLADEAIAKKTMIDDFQRQESDDHVPLAGVRAQLFALAAKPQVTHVP